MSWDCEAYGPEGTRAGALCFAAHRPNERQCASPADCGRLMDGERRRVFAQIRERAAQGDPLYVHLAEIFTDPGQLLGGARDTP